MISKINFEEKIKELLELNVNKFTEKKNGLTYLSWAIAWREFLKVFPEATYKIHKSETGTCYFGDPTIGYMVYTNVTAGGITREMWLPVMDGANKSMKLEAYDYTTKYKEKRCEAMSMFDVNKTVMRCLVKNLAMFGEGLYIYSGEDLPEAQPTNIDCNDLITTGVKKGISAKKIEATLKSDFGHGMEFITQEQHDEVLARLEKLDDKS